MEEANLKTAHDLYVERIAVITNIKELETIIADTKTQREAQLAFFSATPNGNKIIALKYGGDEELQQQVAKYVLEKLKSKLVAIEHKIKTL